MFLICMVSQNLIQFNFFNFQAKPATTTSATTGVRADVETAAGDLRLTRKTIQQINTGTLFFKLGQVILKATRCLIFHLL